MNVVLNIVVFSKDHNLQKNIRVKKNQLLKNKEKKEKKESKRLKKERKKIKEKKLKKKKKANKLILFFEI